LSIVKRLGGFSWHKGTAFILNSQTFLKKKNHQVWFKIFDFGGAKTCAGLVFSCICLYVNILQVFSFPCIYIVRTFASSQGKIGELKN
ncbi:MAG: hypothetical protein J6N73_08160, partial [Prevotella sp.]|nr:hypothetical protein [Prevotella sp.]